MRPTALDETRQNVGDLLRTHLPAGWGFRPVLSQRAEHLPDHEITPNDLSWLIWRPQDIGNRSRCYRLELVGTSGHEFVITHGNLDTGPGPAPERATVFTTWTADQILSKIVRGQGSHGPNRYGRG
ncbi:MAG: hypothetical protein AB7E81_11050 [Hyphomicrobiaceae bacterium]